MDVMSRWVGRIDSSAVTTMVCIVPVTGFEAVPVGAGAVVAGAVVAGAVVAGAVVAGAVVAVSGETVEGAGVGAVAVWACPAVVLIRIRAGQSTAAKYLLFILFILRVADAKHCLCQSALGSGTNPQKAGECRFLIRTVKLNLSV
jgi:hypothetical protein